MTSQKTVKTPKTIKKTQKKQIKFEFEKYENIISTI
jgi:hypothetical protein